MYCTGNDGVIHIYEAATGKIRRSLAGHREYISGVTASADSRRLITGSYDLTALVWDISLAGHFPIGNPAQPRPNMPGYGSNWRTRTRKLPMRRWPPSRRSPKMALAAIRAGIKPARPGAPDAMLDRLFTELDSGTFAVRNARHGNWMNSRKALLPHTRSFSEVATAARNTSANYPVSRQARPRPARLIICVKPRSLEVLEQLNSSDSRSLLAELANGARNAQLTRGCGGVGSAKMSPQKESSRHAFSQLAK